MTTTVFKERSGALVTHVYDAPDWEPFEEYDGKPLERVHVQDLIEPPGALVQLGDDATTSCAPARGPRPRE